MKINIKGPIVGSGDGFIYSWFGIPVTTPQMVEDALLQATQSGTTTITVEINSNGGSVFDASEIYTALKSFNGTVIVQIVGMAASAASVIAMAGDVIEMSPTAQIMIHNASNRAEGDYQEMDENSAFLQNVNKSIMNAYTQKTGKTPEELKNMMDATTWMTSQQALEANFIDKVMFAETTQAVASASNHPMLEDGMLPQAVIDKMRNELTKNKAFAQIVNAVDRDESKEKDETEEVEPEKKVEEEDETMNYETLKNSHPELFNQILNEGMAEGVKNERERIQAIEEIAPNNKSKLVTKAKFETGQTAAEFAMDVLRNQKQVGKNYLKNAEEDAEELEEVDPSSAPDEEKKDSEKEEEETVENLTKIFNKMKGEIK